MDNKKIHTLSITFNDTNLVIVEKEK